MEDHTTRRIQITQTEEVQALNIILVITATEDQAALLTQTEATTTITVTAAQPEATLLVHLAL